MAINKAVATHIVANMTLLNITFVRNRDEMETNCLGGVRGVVKS